MNMLSSQGCYWCLWSAFLFLLQTIPLRAQTQETGANSVVDSLRREYQQRIAKNTKPDSAFSHLCYRLATEFSDHQPDSALVFSYQARQIAAEINDSTAIARAYYATGYIHLNRGQFLVAVEYLLAGLKISERHADTLRIIANTGGLALAYTLQHRYKEARPYFQRSLMLAECLHDTETINFAVNNLGYCFWQLREYDSALTYHQRFYRFSEEAHDTLGIGIAYINFGVCYQGKKDFAQALHYFAKALTIHRRLGNSRNEMLSLYYTGSTLHDMKRSSEALPYLITALQMADTLKMHSQLQDGYIILSKTYTALGRHSEATEAALRYASVKDSLYTTESAQHIAALQTQYESEKKDKQIQLFQKEKKQENFARMLYGIGLAIMLVFATALLYLNRQKSNANSEVMRQKNILEEQAKEIELTNTKLHESNLHLQDLNTEKNEFLGIAAHDMKSPLAGIMISVGMLQRNHAKMSVEQMLKILSSIEHTVKRMSAIISNLLDINAIETGKMNIHFSHFDIIPIIHQVCSDYHARAEAKNITLHFSLTAQNSSVYADPNALGQVIDNLVSNAVKYSPLGKNITVRLHEEVHTLRLEIQDEGKGISPEEQQKLFGKFVRLSTKPTGGEDSTGLGLSIVKKMVEAMNGKVWCESEVGDGLPTGARFIVELLKA